MCDVRCEAIDDNGARRKKQTIPTGSSHVPTRRGAGTLLPPELFVQQSLISSPTSPRRQCAAAVNTTGNPINNAKMPRSSFSDHPLLRVSRPVSACSRCESTARDRVPVGASFGAPANNGNCRPRCKGQGEQSLVSYVIAPDHLLICPVVRRQAPSLYRL